MKAWLSRLFAKSTAPSEASKSEVPSFVSAPLWHDTFPNPQPFPRESQADGSLQGAPLWQARGYDRELLSSSVEGLEQFSLFEVRGSADDKAVMLDYAQRNKCGAAVAILQTLVRFGANDADALFENIVERRDSSTWNGVVAHSPLPRAVEVWLWHYGVEKERFQLIEWLRENRVMVPREILERLEMLESSLPGLGYIYVMYEEGTDPPICKIGQTSLDPRIREQQLNSSTSQHRRIRLTSAWRVNDAPRVEAAIFQAIAGRRVNDRREFFQVDPRQISEYLDSVLGIACRIDP